MYEKCMSHCLGLAGLLSAVVVNSSHYSSVLERSTIPRPGGDELRGISDQPPVPRVNSYAVGEYKRLSSTDLLQRMWQSFSFCFKTVSSHRQTLASICVKAMEPITKWTPKQVVDWMKGKPRTFRSSGNFTFLGGVCDRNSSRLTTQLLHIPVFRLGHESLLSYLDRVS